MSVLRCPTDGPALGMVDLRLLAAVDPACPHGVSGLARRSGIERRQVQRAMARLVAHGLVARIDAAPTAPAALALTAQGCAARVACRKTLFGDLP